MTIVFTNFVDWTLPGATVATFTAGMLRVWNCSTAVCRLMLDGGILIATADHGCDPTWTGTDHT